jgi:hypothetical protein
MYHASIPVFTRQLNNLSTILGLAATHAEAKKIDPSVFLNARLAPDMFPLSRQVQIACDGVKGGTALLAGIEAPSHADDETSFAELQARITKTLDFLQGVSAAQLVETQGEEGRRQVAVGQEVRGQEVHGQEVRGQEVRCGQEEDLDEEACQEGSTQARAQEPAQHDQPT